MFDFAAIFARVGRARPFHARSHVKRGMNIPKAAVLCAAAALAALAVLIGGAWHSAARADGGASARNQAAAPYDSGAAIQSYAQQILHALSGRRANDSVRYRRARDACDAALATHAAPRARVLLALTVSICAQLDALIGVNPAAYPPPGDGLTLNKPEAMRGYTLFKVDHAKNVYLMDPFGRIAHIWHIEDVLLGGSPKLLDNGNLLGIAVEGHAIEFDPDGNIVWRHDGDGGHLHHDFLKMPDGNVMLLVRGRKTREEAIAAGANPEFVHESGLEYDYLLEVRPAGGGEVVWEWSVWDHLVQDFDPAKPNYGAIDEHPELIDINFLLESISKRGALRSQDWTHINSIDYNHELDQIMLSPRHFSELWIIDRSATMEEARGHSGGNSGMGGDLLYRWGNPRAYGQGGAGDQRLFWQHQTHWIPPGLPGAGNILLFNNGNEFGGYKRLYSSVDEFVPPMDGYRYRRDDSAAYLPDRLAWTYAAETPADFYAPYLSGAQRLPNGNTLIVDGTAGAIFQATPGGEVVWRYIVPQHYHISLWQDSGAPARLTHGRPEDDNWRVSKNMVYRAYWYPPDHPGLQALDLAPVAYLEDYPDLLDWARASLAAGDFGQPLANSRYDIYLDNDGDENILIYFKQPCAAEDTQARFFLHIFPADARDIPAERQYHGFVNRGFEFGDRGKTLDGWCVAIAPLPRYPIERISTGQFVSGERELWRAEVELGE